MDLKVSSQSRLYGMNLQGFIDFPERQQWAIDRVKELGVDLVRIQFSWSDIEQTKGKLNFEKHDKIVSLLEKAGLKIIADVGTTPLWLNPNLKNNTYGPSTSLEQNLFANYARTIAERYLGKIWCFEIWNEVNSESFWKPTPNVEAYSSLFVKAYDSIRKVDSSTPIVSSGLAGGGGRDTVSWVRSFLKTPAASKMDGFGIHPYSDGDGKISGFLLETGHIRQLLDYSGFSHIPFYCTETGVSSLGRTLEQQAEVYRVIGDFLQSIPNIACVVWYCLFDSPEVQSWDPKDPEGYFGVFDKNGSPKPAIEEVKNFASRKSLEGIVQVKAFAQVDGRIVELKEVL